MYNVKDDETIAVLTQERLLRLLQDNPGEIRLISC